MTFLNNLHTYHFRYPIIKLFHIYLQVHHLWLRVLASLQVPPMHHVA